ncbi:MAG: glycosyltransferase family 4 protein [Gemmatimonadaceae bacterium]
MSTRDLHIAYLVQQFPPEVGAGPARVTEMAQRWMEYGAEVTAITGIPSTKVPGRAYGEGDPKYRGRFFIEENWDGIRVLRSWLYRNRKPGMLPVLANNVSFMATSVLNAVNKLGDADVLIASAPPLFPHISGAVVARARHIPLVLEIRDLWPDYLVDLGMLRRDAFATRILFALERALLLAASRVVVVTESFRTRVIAKGIPPERVAVIPNGVDLEQYRPEPNAGRQLPFPELERRDGEFVVGYLGTFGAGQDLESTIHAAALVAQEDRTIRFILVGDGPRRADLERAVEAHKLSSVSMHLPIVKDQTRAFYNACDACLVPLADVPVFQETIPSKIFEIMACERPVIASLDGEARRIVEQSGGGIVAKPGDARAIADAVLRAKRLSSGERAAMGRAGRAYVTAHYQRSMLADRYLELLRSAVAHP